MSSRERLQQVRRGELPRADTMNALIDFARSSSVPGGRGEYDDQGSSIHRPTSKAMDALLWFRCESDISVAAFSIVEAYDARFDDDGLTLLVRQASGNGELYAGNEEYALVAGSSGWVKLITSHHPVIVNLDGTAEFLGPLGISGSSVTGSASLTTGLISVSVGNSESRVPVLSRPLDTGPDTDPTSNDTCDTICIAGEPLEDGVTCCIEHRTRHINVPPFGPAELLYTAEEVWESPEFIYNCSEGFSTYLWRLTVESKTSATLELILVSDDGCGQICLKYELCCFWQCQCTNLLKRTQFDATGTDLTLNDVPSQVCVAPEGVTISDAAFAIGECATCGDVTDIVASHEVLIRIETAEAEVVDDLGGSCPLHFKYQSSNDPTSTVGFWLDRATVPGTYVVRHDTPNSGHLADASCETGFDNLCQSWGGTGTIGRLANRFENNPVAYFPLVGCFGVYLIRINGGDGQCHYMWQVHVPGGYIINGACGFDDCGSIYAEPKAVVYESEVGTFDPETVTVAEINAWLAESRELTYCAAESVAGDEPALTVTLYPSAEAVTEILPQHSGDCGVDCGGYGYGGGGGTPSACCPEGTPTVVYATIVVNSGDECAAYEDAPLFWTGSAYVNTVALCGHTWEIHVFCDDGWDAKIVTQEGESEITRNAANSDCNPAFWAEFLFPVVSVAFGVSEATSLTLTINE